MRDFWKNLTRRWRVLLIGLAVLSVYYLRMAQRSEWVIDESVSKVYSTGDNSVRLLGMKGENVQVISYTWDRELQRTEVALRPELSISLGATTLGGVGQHRDITDDIWIVTSESKKVVKFDGVTGEQLGAITAAHPMQIESSPGGRWAVSYSFSLQTRSISDIELHDVATGERIADLSPHGPDARVRFSDDDKSLLVGTADGQVPTVLLFELPDMREIHRRQYNHPIQLSDWDGQQIPPVFEPIPPSAPRNVPPAAVVPLQQQFFVSRLTGRFHRQATTISCGAMIAQRITESHKNGPPGWLSPLGRYEMGNALIQNLYGPYDYLELQEPQTRHCVWRSPKLSNVFRLTGNQQWLIGSRDDVVMEIYRTQYPRRWPWVIAAWTGVVLWLRRRGAASPLEQAAMPT